MDKEAAISSLVSCTDDEEIRSTILKYNPNLDSDCIFNRFKSQKMDLLHKTATFINEGNPLTNLRKQELCNWIIQKIENFLPEYCLMCQTEYCIHFERRSPLECFLCGQGIHAECFSTMIQQTPLPAIPGLKWLCPNCEPRASLDHANVNSTTEVLAGVDPAAGCGQDDNRTNPEDQSGQNQPQNVIVEGTPLIDQKDGSTSVPNPPNESAPAITHPTGSQVPALPQPTSNQEKKICRFYKKNTCKYGISGQGCPYAHPKRCFAAARGCKRTNCKFFHPAVCRSSEQHKECSKTDCKFLHLQGTRRGPSTRSSEPGRWNQAPPALADEVDKMFAENNPQYTYLPNNQPARQQLTKLPQTTTSYHQKPSDPLQDQSFLEVMRSLQQQIKSLEVAQQDQNKILQELIFKEPATNQPDPTISSWVPTQAPLQRSAHLPQSMQQPTVQQFHSQFSTPHPMNWNRI